MSPRSPQIQKYTDTAALRAASELHPDCNSDGLGVQVRKTLRAKRVTVTREARNRDERSE